MKSKRELLDGIEPGTTIYCLEEDGYVGYLYMATCKDKVFISEEAAKQALGK